MRFFVRLPLRVLVLAGVPVSPLALGQVPQPLPTPHLDLLVEGEVNAIVRQPDGGLVIGGGFSHVNGVRRAGLARLLPSGELDPAWNPGVEGNVYTLATDSEGDIYVGGSFRTVGALERNHLAKVSGTGHGQVDTSWNPTLYQHDHVWTLSIDGSGSVFVGGFFGAINGQLRQNLAKLTSTGEVDPEWDPGSSCRIDAMALDRANEQLYVVGCFDTGVVARTDISGSGLIDPLWAPSPNGSVAALAIHDDSIYMGGNFNHIGGEDVRYLAKISMLGTGSADPVWQPVAMDAQPATFDTLAVDPAGHLYVGGEFEEVGGVARQNAARIDMDGWGASDPGWNPGVDARVMAFQPVDDESVIVAGRFSTVGATTRWGLATIDDAGSVSDQVLNVGRGSAVVLAMVRQGDGGMILGGRFKAANGILRDNLLRLRPNGLLDEDWNPSVDGYVYTLALDANDDVFVGGSFSSVDGQPRQYLAKVSGQLGTVDPIWNPAADNIVDKLVVHDSGIVIAAGGFDQVGGQSRHRLAKLSSTGSGQADPLWDPSPDFQIYDMVVSESGAIYLAGTFTVIGGQMRRGLAKLSIHGSGDADIAWNPAPASGFALFAALALDATGSLYVGGSFSSIGGQARTRLAKLAADGAGDADPVWNPSSNGNVMLLAATDDGRVYVSGTFTQISGQAHQKLARLSQDGSGLVDPDWRPFAPYNIAFQVHSVVSDDIRRKIYIAGDIKELGTIARHGFAAFNADVDAIFFDGFQ